MHFIVSVLWPHHNAHIVTEPCVKIDSARVSTIFPFDIIPNSVYRIPATCCTVFVYSLTCRSTAATAHSATNRRRARTCSHNISLSNIGAIQNVVVPFNSLFHFYFEIIFHHKNPSKCRSGVSHIVIFYRISHIFGVLFLLVFRYEKFDDI